jgi:glycosyltransferase involved in cell wall biosynthesis
MRPLVVASNVFNEIDQVECEDSWYDNVCKIADGGILVVDTGSTDGTKEFFESKDNVVFITNDIIVREGYGPARNYLREKSFEHFPGCHWVLYLDFDERIMEEDFHTLRFLKEYLDPEWDVIALPRLNRLNKDTLDTKVDFHIHPDYQARMTRIASGLKYVRKLHEQIVGYNKIYAQLTNPKIHHFHRSTDQKKRDRIGKLCAKLHMEDVEHGGSYPEHHKEAYYRELLEKEGL